MLGLAAMTGLRRGEMCGLRWVDVDLDGASLAVRQTGAALRQPAPEGSGRKWVTELVTGDVKTARSRRTVDLDAETVTVLHSHRRQELEQRLAMGEGHTDHGLVFAMPDGSPWNPETVPQAFTRLVTWSGLPRVRRTTYGTVTPPGRPRVDASTTGR